MQTLQQWAAAARRHVEAGFRIEDEAAALNALYRELLDSAGRPGLNNRTLDRIR